MTSTRSYKNFSYASVLNSFKNCSTTTMDHISLDGRFLPLWCLRCIQLIFTLSVMGIAGSDASDFHSIDCHTPAKIGFHIAVAVLSMLALLYLIFSTAPKPVPRFLLWHMWTQLGLDSFFFILWIAAAGCSTFTLHDFSNACPWFSDTEDLLGLKVRDFSGLEKRTSSHGSSFGSTHSAGVSVGARQGLDAMLVIFFAASLAYTGFYIYLYRNSLQSTTGHAPVPDLTYSGATYWGGETAAESQEQEQKYAGETMIRETNRTPSPQPPPQQAEQVRLHPGYAGQVQQHRGYEGYGGEEYYAERR